MKMHVEVEKLVQKSVFFCARNSDSCAGIAGSRCIFVWKCVLACDTPAIDPVAEIMLSPIVSIEIQDTKIL
jgi:hypothetical protein